MYSKGLSISFQRRLLCATVSLLLIKTAGKQTDKIFFFW